MTALCAQQRAHCAAAAACCPVRLQHYPAQACHPAQAVARHPLVHPLLSSVSAPCCGSCMLSCAPIAQQCECTMLRQLHAVLCAHCSAVWAHHAAAAACCPVHPLLSSVSAPCCGSCMLSCAPIAQQCERTAPRQLYAIVCTFCGVLSAGKSCLARALTQLLWGRGCATAGCCARTHHWLCALRCACLRVLPADVCFRACMHTHCWCLLLSLHVHSPSMFALGSVGCGAATGPGALAVCRAACAACVQDAVLEHSSYTTQKGLLHCSVHTVATPQPGASSWVQGTCEAHMTHKEMQTQ